jgi:hypothetical protein
MGKPQIQIVPPVAEEEKKKQGRKPRPADLYTLARDLEHAVKDLEVRKQEAVAKYDLQIEEALSKAPPEVVKFMKMKQKLESAE